MPDAGPNKAWGIEGDISQVAAGAIVNAANAELGAGGGVCGSIRAAGIAQLTEACRETAAVLRALVGSRA